MPGSNAIRTLLIVNPGSRQGAEATLDEGVERLRDAGFEIEVYLSEGPEQSRRAVRERRERLDLVIMAGGDGTISSMAQTLYECRLPLGTANDLARTLGVPQELSAAFDVIAANQRRRIDLGVVNKHHFFNVANLGLGVQVTEELTDEVKKQWGVFSYLRAFFAALLRRRQFRVRLGVDGQCQKLRSIQLAVGNGRYYGGGNVIRDCASVDDGLLSLYSVRPLGVWELLTLAPLLREGQYDLDHRVVTARGRRIDIDTRPTGMSIHADGEPITATPAQFHCLPGALEVVAPSTADNTF
ncbi:lipid kinase [Marinimicrobium sp. C6131]|uniref:lipid kinase n=1 Tax=Marinimicrobium sp. C6131 TaxID=3022676 RepID=UPI00223CC560|nr:lipid kinase [Marinimicrobium sp. C6131]UZJ44025.1 lipid kinase [Marinimicrobium sp. C6131]